MKTPLRTLIRRTPATRTTTRTSNRTTTRTRVLRTALAAAITTVATVPMITATPALGAPATCSTNCVDRFGSSMQGDTFSLSTTVPAIAKVDIYRDAARLQPVGSAVSPTNDPRSFHTMPITAWSPTPALSPNLPPAPLAPNTTYWVRIVATDGIGTTTVTGSFKTAPRFLKLTIDSIIVTGDSDYSGAGELTYDLRMPGGTVKRIYGPKDTSEGTLSNLGSYVVGNVPSNFTFQVRGQDDDCEWSTCQVSSSEWGSGSTSDVEWATATSPTFVITSNSTTVGTFSFYTPGAVSFTVTGRWRVDNYPMS